MLVPICAEVGTQVTFTVCMSFLNLVTGVFRAPRGNTKTTSVMLSRSLVFNFF